MDLAAPSSGTLVTASLLIPDSPLQVLPRLAALIGLQEAIVLQQIHFLSLRAPDGWLHKTLDDWLLVFPWTSKRTLERTFKELIATGLLKRERVPGGGGRTRDRIDYDQVDELAETASRQAEDLRQIGGTPPPDWRDSFAKVAGGSRQIGGSRLCKGERERTAETAGDAPLADRKATIEGWVSIVFEAWAIAVDNPTAVLDANRRRTIRKALRGRPFETALTDCVDAVRGWRHSAYHRGENAQGIPKNTLTFLLRDADSIDELAGYERHRGASQPLAGNVAACPGFAPSTPLGARWAAIAARAAELVPADVHDIWLRPLHPHADVAGVLVVGLPPELMAFVGGRLRGALDEAATAAGEQPVTLIDCSSNALRAANAA